MSKTQIMQAEREKATADNSALAELPQTLSLFETEMPAIIKAPNEETTMDEIEKIEKQMAELAARKQEILSGQRRDALNEVKKTIAKFGFSARDLGLDKPGKGDAAPRKPKGEITFSNPETGESWAGDLNRQGRRPKWILDKIADGTIENYRVKK